MSDKVKPGQLWQVREAYRSQSVGYGSDIYLVLRRSDEFNWEVLIDGKVWLWRNEYVGFKDDILLADPEEP